MYKVGITGINAVDNPGPGVGIAKSIKKSEEIFSLLGLSYDAMEPGNYLPWLFDKCFILPYPSEGELPFLERLFYIKNTFGLDAIIPSLDAELPLFIKNQVKLASIGIKTFLPTKKQFNLRSKDKLFEVAKKIGIKVPETWLITSYEDFWEKIAKLTFPIMVKGIFYEAFKAYSPQEASSFFSNIVSKWGYPVLIQEVVSGEEMNVVGVGDGEGGHFGLFAIKKLWITSLGKIWTGVSVKNKNLLEVAEKFIAEFKWRGAFELECIVNKEGIYLIEINPRFPAWIYFATGAGINLPYRLLKASLGIEPERTWDYQAGKLYIRYTEDLVTDLLVFQNLITKGEC